MKLCYMYDDAFVPLKDRFLLSLKDDFELISLKLNKPKFQDNAPPHELYGGGIDVWLEKPKYLLRVIDQCQPDEYFIYSDIDITFFQPILPTLDQVLNNKDVLFLREIPDGMVPWQGGDVAGNCNFGFCVVKACERTKAFFQDVLTLIERTRLMDQTVVNKILFGTPEYPLDWGVLPIEFTTTPFINENKLSHNSLMFHAICCVEQHQKFELLDYATKIVNDAKTGMHEKLAQ